MEYLLGVNLGLKNYFERKFNIIRGFWSSSSSSSSARMAPGSPNPRLKFNSRICYPLSFILSPEKKVLSRQKGTQLKFGAMITSFENDFLFCNVFLLSILDTILLIAASSGLFHIGCFVVLAHPLSFTYMNPGQCSTITHIYLPNFIAALSPTVWVFPVEKKRKIRKILKKTWCNVTVVK